MIKRFFLSAFSLASPQPRRRVNPFLAALLELLGLVGFLGLGRMFAGDPNGSKVLGSWLGICIGLIVSSAIAFLLSIPASLVTFGLASFVVSAGIGIGVTILSLVPLISAFRLFIALI